MRPLPHKFVCVWLCSEGKITVFLLQPPPPLKDDLRYKIPMTQEILKSHPKYLIDSGSISGVISVYDIRKYIIFPLSCQCVPSLTVVHHLLSIFSLSEECMIYSITKQAKPPNIMKVQSWTE